MKTRTAIRKRESARAFLAIRTGREYDLAVRRLNALVDEIGDHPKDPRYRLIETLSVLIEAYDKQRHGLPEVSGVDVVRFLMEQHGLKQEDLPEIGSQGVVSEILTGRRALNVRQILGLAERFGVEPSAFLGTADAAPLRRARRAPRLTPETETPHKTSLAVR
jgi:HTH-type transcriptional regulator / antitoxin HigA